MKNMRDVARLAGVSIATVSNYVNGSKALRPETQAKVEQAIEALNFHPNTTARSLKKTISNEIGIVLPSISDPYYSSVFKGIEKVFQTDGNFINLAFSDEIESKERSIIASFLEKRISGIIIATCQPDNKTFFERNVVQNRLPIVFIDRKPAELDINFVGVDTYKPILLMTEKLLMQGFRRIALVTGPLSFSSESNCHRAYIDAHEKYAIPVIPELCTPIRPFKEAAFDAGLRLMASYHPDAVITSSQLLLEGMLEALHLRHLRPQIDIPVFSLGQDVWNTHTFCPNVFLSQRPAIDVGECAARILKQNIASPIVFETTCIELADNANIDLLEIPQKHETTSPPREPQKHLKILMESAHGTASAVGSLAKDFEVSCNCVVTIETRPMEEMFSAIMANAYQGNDGYDIIMYDIPWLPSFADEGVLMDITDYVRNGWHPESYLSPKLPDFYGAFNDRYYGIPFTYSPPILFYRKDLFENPALKKAYREKYRLSLRPPRTWTEYNALAEFFNETAQTGIACEHGLCLYGQSKEHLIPHFLPRLAAFGGRIFNDRLQITIESSACRKALESIKQTSILSSMPYKSSTLISATQEFYEGKTAILFGHGSYATALSKDISSPVAGKVDYAPLPGKSPHISGWGLGISAASRQRDLALHFFDWLCRSDISTYSTILEGQSLLFGSHSNSELQKIYPWLALEFDSLSDMTLRSGAYLPGGKVVPRDRIEDCIYQYICSYLNDETNLEDTMAGMEKDLKKLFRSYGYSGV